MDGLSSTVKEEKEGYALTAKWARRIRGQGEGGKGGGIPIG